jgi:starch synthase
VINILKGGIIFADQINTVSPTYKEEILTPAHGHGLEGTLKAHIKKLHGILNGIDPDFWNPEKDPHLIERYPAIRSINKKNLSSLLKAKEENKRQLCTHLGLDMSRGPLIGCVTRLVSQKGPALIASAIKRAVAGKALFVLLGSEYSTETKKVFEELKKELADTHRFGLLLDRNESIAHLIFSGSDFITVPSLFEPCGLTQLIALRYGSLPIVRRTGGLADTVFDIDGPFEEDIKNGISFLDPSKTEIESAIDRAIDLWRNEKEHFGKIVLNALRSDYSWRASGARYISLYSSFKK